MAVNVVVRGKWKSVEIEPSLFLQKDMNHLICIEELTDYNIVDTKNTEVIHTDGGRSYVQNRYVAPTHCVLIIVEQSTVYFHLGTPLGGCRPMSYILEG